MDNTIHDCEPLYPHDSLQDRLQNHITENLQESIRMNEKVDKIIRALDIDEDGTSQLKKKVEDMHMVFSSASWAGKMVLKSFVVIGTVTGAVIGLIELWKRLK